VVLIDTAGRLQTKYNLMEELKKIDRVVQKRLGRPLDERLLVLDATTGQNAVSQAKKFNEAVPLTGLILTKLDSTAKGGAIFPIYRELRLPIKLIGVGEGAEDLQEFRAAEFVEALLQI
jgi:fused signal recognition particle receptor